MVLDKVAREVGRDPSLTTRLQLPLVEDLGKSIELAIEKDEMGCIV